MGGQVCVRVQLPLSLDDYSEPEPDIAVVSGKPRDYRDAHPKSALLVVEVAETTLPQDRVTKARGYARADIEDFWILNIPEAHLEVLREPDPAKAIYQSRRRFGAADRVSPLACPQASIAVVDLLP